MLKGAVTFVKGRSLKGGVVGVRERMGLSFRSDDDFLFQNIYRRKEIVVHVHCRLFYNEGYDIWAQMLSSDVD